MSETISATIEECLLVEGIHFYIGKEQYRVRHNYFRRTKVVIINTRTGRESKPPKNITCDISLEDANKIADRLLEDHTLLTKQLEQLRKRIIALKTYPDEELQEYKYPTEGLSETAKEFVKEHMMIGHDIRAELNALYKLT